MIDSRKEETIGSKPPMSAKLVVISSGCIISFAIVSVSDVSI